MHRNTHLISPQGSGPLAELGPTGWKQVPKIETEKMPNKPKIQKTANHAKSRLFLSWSAQIRPILLFCPFCPRGVGAWVGHNFSNGRHGTHDTLSTKCYQMPTTHAHSFVMHFLSTAEGGRQCGSGLAWKLLDSNGRRCPVLSSDASVPSTSVMLVLAFALTRKCNPPANAAHSSAR